MNYFFTDRAIFDHPFFSRDIYSRRDAWLWLIASALWKEQDVFVRGHKLVLQRGQLSFSIRFMAAKWLWDKSKVERFLGALKTEAMIKTEYETGQLIITICNYDVYQKQSEQYDTQIKTENETLVRQSRDSSETKKKNDKKDNNDKKDIKIIADELFPEVTLPDWIPIEQWQAFKAMRNKKGKGKGLTKYAEGLAIKTLKKLKDEGHNPIEVLEQSILGSYDGLFAPKEKNKQNTMKTFDEIRKENNQRALEEAMKSCVE